MYATSISDIEIPFLANAAYVLSLRENDKGEKIYKFRSLYMDKSGNVPYPTMASSQNKRLRK